MRSRTMLVTLLVLALPAAGAAQARGFSLGGAGIYATLSGDDFSDTDAGFGADVQARYSWGSVSVGVGGVLTSHGVDGVDEKLSSRGVFVEPRYVFRTGSGSVAPYLAGRAALLWWSLDTQGSEFRRSGRAFGAEGGILVRLGGRADLDVMVGYYAVSFGDIEIDGSEFSGTDVSGGSLALRAGVEVRLGR